MKLNLGFVFLQEERARDVQAEKFQMNPNAEMFQSKMHSSYSVSDDGQNADGFSQGPHDDHQGDYGEWIYDVTGL